MKKQVSQIIRFLIFLFTALFLLYLAFRGINLNNVWKDIKHAHYAWLLITIPIGILSHIFRAWRWNLLIEPLGYKPRLLNTFYAVMSGYLANLALPRLGEVVRCGSLTKTDKIPFDALIGTVIIERVVDMIILIILLIITFLIKINFFGQFFIYHVFKPMGTKIASMASHPVALILTTAGIILILYLPWLFREKLKNISFTRKILDFINGIINGIRTIGKLKNRKMFLFSSFLIWLMYYIPAWLVVYMLPETSFLGPVDGLFLLVVGAIGFVIPVQGGIGAYHWIISQALTLYGIPRETGLALATISHESQTLLILILGSFSMIMVVLIKNKSVTPPQVSSPDNGV